MRALVFVLFLAGCGGLAAAPARVATRALAIGVTHGALEGSDRVEDEYHHVDDYDLALDAQQLVRIHVPDGAFDPWLRVEGPDGFHAEDDDVGPGTLDAMIQFRAPASGVYRVSIAAAERGEIGPYEIHVETLSELSGDALAIGTSIDGTFGTPSDARLRGSSFFHLEARGGSIVRFEAGDALVTVIGPRGERWASHDGEPMLVVPIPTSGGYQVIVSPPSATSGRFTLRTSERAPVIASTSASWAGPDGRGRVLGVFAGISDYEAMPDLYGASDDARFLADATSATHLVQADDRRVLLDGQATRAAFLDSVAWLAGRAGPDDVAIVFFAGHGDRQPGAEIDGFDETIVLADEPITDDDVVRALDAVHAGTLILALDACHSGGFDADFMTRAGRIGLFSSDADVISDTAEAHRAGGYLSWYLRRGLLGEADASPHDGALYAGELTDFVHTGFARDDVLINPPGHAGPGQFAVIDRGSAAWDTILWVYPRGEDLALPRPPELALQSAEP